PRGQFSLMASRQFLEHFTPAARSQVGGDHRRDAVLRLAFCVEGSWSPASAEVSQRSGGAVHVLARAGSQPAAVAAVEQAIHMLSLDIDGSGLDDAVCHDEVASALVKRSPGFRPVGFYSPYEAAVWAVISQRIRMVQAAAIKAAIARRLGHSLS